MELRVACGSAILILSDYARRAPFQAPSANVTATRVKEEGPWKKLGHQASTYFSALALAKSRFSKATASCICQPLQIASLVAYSLAKQTCELSNQRARKPSLFIIAAIAKTAHRLCMGHLNPRLP